MKKLQLLTLWVFSSLATLANPLDTLVENAKISKAVVYYKGATIHRVLDLTKTGEYILRLKGLPLDIDRKSITIEADESVEIKSVKSDYELPSMIQKVADTDTKSMSQLTDSIEFLNILIGVLDEEYDMITTNKNFEKDEDITSMQEVVLASEFYQSRVKALKLERLEQARTLKKLTAQKDTLLKHTQKETAQSNKKELTIYVHIDNNKSGAKLRLNYYHPKAQWSPYYDLKAGKNEENLLLHRKAYVSQSTKEDWENIKITLSTSVPTNDNRLPYLSPNRLGHQNHNNRSNNYYTTVNTNGKSGKVIDSNGEPLIGVNVYIQGTDQGTITDFDGQFYLPQAIGKTIVVKYVGYSNVVCTLPQQYAVFTLSEGSVLDEIVVVGKGRRNRTSAKYEEPKRKQIDLKINETLNTLSYELSKTYSIKSDSEPIDVLLKKESLPTLLQYESIPVKNESAFLIAEIKDWHLYNLEPAPINLFIDGTFKGKSSLDPDSQDDKLKISLGTDPEVSLSRKWINNKYKKKLLSRHKEETHHYTLTIKNNKTKPIAIKIKDQIPISSDTAIEIKPENISGGKLEEESGYVNWELELESGESKELELIYKLKYPKHYDINL